MKKIIFQNRYFNFITNLSILFLMICYANPQVHANIINTNEISSPSIEISLPTNGNLSYFSIDEEIFHGPFIVTSEHSKIAENDLIILDILEDYDYGISLVDEDFSSKRSYLSGDVFYLKIPKSSNEKIENLFIEAKGVQNIITASIVEDTHFSKIKEISLQQNEIDNSSTLSTKEIPPTYNYPIFAFNNGKQDEYQENEKSTTSSSEKQDLMNNNQVSFSENTHTNIPLVLSETTLDISELNNDLNTDFNSQLINEQNSILVDLNENSDDTILNTLKELNEYENQNNNNSILLSEENFLNTNTKEEDTHQDNLIDIIKTDETFDSELAKDNPKTFDNSIEPIYLIMGIYFFVLITIILFTIRYYVINHI